MDEPLSNLDAKLRVQTRAEIASSNATRTTILRHTRPDRSDDDGRPHRRDAQGDCSRSPHRGALRRPVNLFVGGFIGSPAMNLVEATLERANGGLTAASAASGSRSARRRCPPAPRSRVRRPPRDPRHPARASRGRSARPRRPVRSDTRGRGAADRGARLRGDGAFLDRREPANTDEVRELEKDAGTEEMPSTADGRGGAMMVGRFGARSKARKGEPTKVAVERAHSTFSTRKRDLASTTETKENA